MGRRKQNDIDWPAIERDFRLGQFSVRQIAANHGVNASSISRRAEKERWAQDRSSEVKERTRAALIAGPTTANAPTDDDVKAAVETNVALVREHRRDIREGREMAKTLMGELREVAENREEIEGAIEEETRRDKNPRRRAMMLRAVALPTRAAVLGNLASTQKTYIGLERVAHNLSDGPESDDGAVVYEIVNF